MLVKDENTAPTSWPLARVTEVHSDKDGKVRVVTLKLQTNTLKSPIHKPCPLLNTSDEEQVSPPVKNCCKYWLEFLLLIMFIKPARSKPIAIYIDKVVQINTVTSKWRSLKKFIMGCKQKA